ncbi:DUF421 domain-containing protein [Nitrosomonas eutropha]|uniref:Uncharacterized protein DUF421 n=2 Tax=Nitrosomonas eutropha TaxID=916 RepID=A0ABX5M304_9PROT|nr:YetF domain-containing protein [Nitrosomonas eutropha]ABI59569.1 conserved hypothetical protein [Nitrosomonas eutropha C91]PXV72147.1 uncharacterized protein DUF421 [Nitrosomonas eutropha]
MDLEIFNFSVSPWEILIRGSLMYWALFIIFRFILRRNVGAMEVSDVLFIVIVSDAAQNAMSGSATNIADGLLLVSTLVFWNLLLDYLSFRFLFLRKFIVSPPIILINDGVLQWKNMRKQFITKDELNARMREEGLEEIALVKEMRLESNGEISVIKAN